MAPLGPSALGVTNPKVTEFCPKAHCLLDSLRQKIMLLR